MAARTQLANKKIGIFLFDPIGLCAVSLTILHLWILLTSLCIRFAAIILNNYISNIYMNMIFAVSAQYYRSVSFQFLHKIMQTLTIKLGRVFKCARNPRGCQLVEEEC